MANLYLTPKHFEELGRGVGKEDGRYFHLFTDCVSLRGNPTETVEAELHLSEHRYASRVKQGGKVVGRVCNNCRQRKLAG